MSIKNSTILAHAWMEGTNDFQQRIPNPDISGYDACVRELFQPYNNDLFNQFAGMAVGMMGTYVEGKVYENSLREVKKPAAEWGNTERHVAVKYLDAHSYKMDDETLLKLERPEYVEWFYSVNQNRRYEFSWSKYELSRVFASGDSYGFDTLLATTLDQMRSSDNYDEMCVMLNTFAVADERTDGLFRRNITSAPTDKDSAQELLVKIKADAGKMQFPSTLYNKIDVPVFETPQTLVLWATPETDAYLDVMALAELFHVERAEVNFRKIVIPEFPLPNVYAALTSEDFIYARDVWYGIEPPFYNNANRTYKYYLFHDQIIGFNPAANCILYTTDAETNVPTIEQTFEGIAFSPDTYNVVAGGSVKLNLVASGTIDPETDGVAVEPAAATYEVASEKALNSRTYVDKYGVLHVQKSGLVEDDTLTVTAKSSYINPSGDTTEYTDTATVTIVSADAVGSKDGFVESNPNIVYTPNGEVAYTGGSDAPSASGVGF